MAITYVDSVQEKFINVASPRAVTLTSLPTHTTDDILISFIKTNISNGEAPQIDDDGAGSNGWVFVTDRNTALGRDQHCAILYKICTSASEANPTFTESSSATNSGWLVTTVCYRGVDTTTPLDTTTIEYEASNEGDTPTSSSITTVTDNAWVLTLCSMTHYSSSATATPPSGYTERVDGWDSNNFFHLIGDKEVTSAGAENPGTWTVTTADTAAELMSFTMALRPAVTSTEYTESNSYTGTGSSSLTKDVGKVLSAGGSGTAGIAKSVGKVLSQTGTGTAAAATQTSYLRSFSVTASGSPAFAEPKLDLLLALSTSGVVTPALDIAVGSSKSSTGTGSPSLSKKVFISNAYSNTGTAAFSKALAVSYSASMTGTGTGVLDVTTQYTLSSSYSANSVADLTKHVGINKSHSGVGTADKSRGIALNKAVSGEGTVSSAEAIGRTKSLSYTGVGSSVLAAVKQSPVVVTTTNIVRQLFSQVSRWF